MEENLKETYYFDYSDEGIQSMVEEFRSLSDQEKVEGLFLKVRDEWRYNPFIIYTSKEKYKASFIVQQEQGHCIDKSTLFIAGLRALGIPSRIRLAKVANHIAAEGLIAKLGSNHLAPHGVADVYVNDKWTKASTAFNKTLCDKYDVEPLSYDGTEDSIFQAYNRKNEKYMEYLEDYGSFEDVPLDFIIQTFSSNYPQMAEKMAGGKLEI